jgi:hypothetical protein
MVTRLHAALPPPRLNMQPDEELLHNIAVPLRAHVKFNFTPKPTARHTIDFCSHIPRTDTKTARVAAVNKGANT